MLKNRTYTAADQAAQRDYQRKQERAHTETVVRSCFSQDRLQLWEKANYVGRFAIGRKSIIELCKTSSNGWSEVLTRFKAYAFEFDLQTGMTCWLETLDDDVPAQISFSTLPALIPEHSVFIWLPFRPDVTTIPKESGKKVSINIAFKCMHDPNFRKTGNTFIRLAMEA